MRRLLIISTVLALGMPLLVPATAGAQEGNGAPEGIETTQGKTEPVYDNSVTEEYTVETEHGTLYGEVIRPLTDDGEPVQAPVILTYSPYNVITYAASGGGSIAADGMADYYVPRGYARAVFDLVGTRKSSGCYDYGGDAERETGASLVDFLGEQDWSTGRVGMIGGSYNGTTAIAAAVENPEHLTTIIPQVAIDRWYDYAFGGGIRYFLNNENPSDEGFDTPLAFDFGFAFAPPADVSHPNLYAEATVDHIRPCDKIAHTEAAYQPDPVYDEFWKERDYRRRADNVTASVFLEGGWHDHNVKNWESTNFFSALPEDVPKKLAIGQWFHSASQFPDAQDLRHAWFDHWLMGLDTGVMDLPSVDTQLNTQGEPGSTNTGEREQEVVWPPHGTRDVSLELVSQPATDESGEAAEPNQGKLASDQATSENGQVTFSDTPGAPVTEEEMFRADGSDAQGRFVKLETAPLDSAVRISGMPVLELLARSTGTQFSGSMHFTPVLYDVGPGGTTQVITRGFLNGRNRNGLDVSEPVPTDEVYRAPVQFWDQDYLLEEDHRLGVVIAADNADWVLDDPDGGGTTSVSLAGGETDGTSVLRLPVSQGHAALGVPPPPSGPRTACPPNVVPESGFGDTRDSVHRANIDCIAWYTITEGVTADRYAPGEDVSRAQMASYLTRLAVEGGVDLPGDPDDGFEDDTDSVHETAINQIAALGIAEGTGNGEFSPGDTVSRAQMASFIARTHQSIIGGLPGNPADAFTDDDGSDHETAINQLAALGVISGQSDSTDVDGDGDTEERIYRPTEPIIRATQATFLANDLKTVVRAGQAYPGGAEVRLDDQPSSSPGELSGTVATNKPLVALAADGCGLSERRIEVADGGAFSVNLSDDAEDDCELTLTTTTRRRDARPGVTQSVAYTLASIVDGED